MRRRRLAQGDDQSDRRLGPTGFSFAGLAAWQPGAGIIECRVGSWLLDLHNCADFVGYAFGADGVLTLTWYHHDPRFGPQDPHLVTLAFGVVRDLRVAQVEDWDARSAGETHGWDYWADAAGTRGALLFHVADSELAFTAAGVRLQILPTGARPAPD